MGHNASAIRMRKYLDASDADASPGFPDGVRVVRFVPAEHARACHALLAEVHQDRVDGFDRWWEALSGDAEYAPATCFIAVDAAGVIAGVAICWSVPFMKDLAVAPGWRRRGLGAALMRHAFAWFARRGHRHVDLKVAGDNPWNARALYLRLGMLEVPA